MNKMLLATAILLVAVVTGFGVFSISNSAGAAGASSAAVGDPVLNITNVVRRTKASLDFTCPNGKKFSLSTGTKKGTCGAGHTVAECTDGNGNSARVECSNDASGTNCKSTSGAGTCTSH